MAQRRDRIFAQDTKVPVSQTEREIRKLLKEVGSTKYALVEDGDSIAIRFQVGLAVFQIERPGLPPIPKASEAQKERAAWRAMGLLVKAKCTAIKQGISTVEHEFMADTLLADGSTMGEHYEQIRGHNYDDGTPQIGFKR